MWAYQKKLQYPVKIANPDPALAKVIITQLGGPDCKKRGSRGLLHRCMGSFLHLPKAPRRPLNGHRDAFLVLCFPCGGQEDPEPPPICLMIW